MTPYKGNFVTKRKPVFLLICLNFHLIDHIGKQAFIGKNFLHSFINFLEHFF